MIVDLERFIREERPYWRELEGLLDTLHRDAGCQMGLVTVKRLHYLYERASADLGKFLTFAAEPETRRYLEALVARAYGEIHETRGRPHRFAPFHWFFVVFPQTFRRHLGAFGVVVAITLVGSIFGGFAILFDPDAKEVIMPFPGVLADPAQRVEMEEGNIDRDRLEGSKAMGAAFYMTHNTKVSILTMAAGMLYGIGTVVLLFYNGVILGAVALDYILAGETVFLVGWLLPHGSVEIPA
ncbi:MAG: stage II sporulation protein M, partial [bacterium]|nr:stage II sporulation protein M [bacterium]